MTKQNERIDTSQEALKPLQNALDGVERTLGALSDLELTSLPPERTALVVMDLINGFTTEGPLKSPRVASLVPGIAQLAEAMGELGVPVLAFADSHSETNPEFEAYPTHCLLNSTESELVPELKTVKGLKRIDKNSTNGFLEPEFQAWLAVHPEKDIFVVTGDCTDICIQQFAVTLKAWFNRQNRSSRVLVPTNLVDTFDHAMHQGDLMHRMALFSMMGNGVEVVKAIQSEETKLKAGDT